MENIKADDEFIAKRCDEILEHDEEYQKLNLEILDVEKKIREKLTDDLGIFLEYERLTMEQLAISNIKIYKSLL